MRVLVKIGGTLVDEPGLRQALGIQIAAAQRDGHTIVVVHGGGRQLTQHLEERGIESRFIDGLRVTTDESMDAVLKVLAGSVNKQLTGALRAAGANPVGISGVDGRLTTASRMSEQLGCVGSIQQVDATLLRVLTHAGMIPVVACVAGDDCGRAWNINADRMAVACAEAFGADRLIFLTDVPGVLDANGDLLPSLNPESLIALIESGVARGGMRAKLTAAAAAVAVGIRSVCIAPGADADVLLGLLAGERFGTEISPSITWEPKKPRN